MIRNKCYAKQGEELTVERMTEMMIAARKDCFIVEEMRRKNGEIK